MMPDFGNHHVAQPAQDDERHDRSHDHRAVAQSYKVVLIDREAGITKSGDGVKGGREQCL